MRSIIQASASKQYTEVYCKATIEKLINLYWILSNLNASESENVFYIRQHRFAIYKRPVKIEGCLSMTVICDGNNLAGSLIQL